MYKKVVLAASRLELNFLVKLNKVNSDFGANNVSKLLFGKDRTIKNIVNNIGSNYGLKKVTAFGN